MTNATVTAPVATSSAAAIAPPSLYVGADLDHKPYRPPVFGRRGWRVAIGAPIVAMPPTATATATAPAPLPQVSLASLPADRAIATVAAIAPVVAVSYGVQATTATAQASSTDPARMGEYRNPYVVDAVATATAEAFLPNTSATANLALPTATANATAPAPRTTLVARPDVAQASAAALAPTVVATRVITAPIATAIAATVAPVAELAVMVDATPATATATALDPTVTANVSTTAAVATATAAATAPAAAVIPVIRSSAGVAGFPFLAMPAHSPGDLLIMFAYRYTVNSTSGLTPPTTPAQSGTVPAWTTISANTGNSYTSGANTHYNSLKVAYAVATANNHSSGSWTNANLVAVLVVSSAAASPIGGNAETGGDTTTSTLTAPAVTMSKSDGTSLLIHAYTPAFASSLTWSAAPTGYTQILTRAASNVAAAILTKNVSTSDGAVDQAITRDANIRPYRAATIEILAP